MSRPYLLQFRVAPYASAVLREAGDLFRQRRVSYALLALTLTAGAVYIASTAYPMVTEGGVSSSRTTHTAQSTMNQGGNMSDSTGQPSSDNQFTTGDDSNSTTTQTTVTVNGQDIPVPDNGSVHRTMSDTNSQTSVDVTHESSAGGYSSSLQVQVESRSSGGGNAPSE